MELEVGHDMHSVLEAISDGIRTKLARHDWKILDRYGSALYGRDSLSEKVLH